MENGQWDVKALTTPKMPDTRLSIDDCSQDYVDPHFHKQYRGIVGSLGWIVGMTRPDCSYAHASLSRFVQYPGQAHMAAALRVLAHFSGTVTDTSCTLAQAQIRINTTACGGG